MEMIRKYSRSEAVGIVTLALVVVLAYSVWGAYVLRQQQVSTAQGTAVADTR